MTSVLEAATALLLQMSSLGANEKDNDRGNAQGNRPIHVTFTNEVQTEARRVGARSLWPER
jgi:hypothetical protein